MSSYDPLITYGMDSRIEERTFVYVDDVALHVGGMDMEVTSTLAQLRPSFLKRWKTTFP